MFWFYPEYPVHPVIEVGLLINFGNFRLEIKRCFKSKTV